MKNKIYTIFLLGLSLLLLSNCKNPEIGYETFAITDESIEPEVYGAKVNGSFSFSGNVQEMKMKIATDESLTDATDYSTIIGDQTFSAEIEGLEPSTTYYYCYSINFGWKDNYLTDINSFSTLDHSNDSLTIVTSCNPTTGGTATGGGTFTYGQSCTITASAAIGYTFTNWTENDSLVSTNTSYTFTVNSNRILVANFQALPQNYTITVSANPTEGGSVTGSDTYQEGQECTVTATPAVNYTFVNWTENGTVASPDASYTFSVNGNRTLVANFTYNGGCDAPTGAINGKFTINPNGDQVYFSKGNLQYIGSASTPYWKFADNQWDYLSDNGQFSASPTADRDLFGWGTSGYNHNNAAYQPWSTSEMASNYNAYGDSSYDLNSKTGEADWGYNLISNGGNMTNEWHTLTTAEWIYVINQRTTLSGNRNRYAKAIVHNIKGVILLPDDWMDTYFDLQSPDTYNADFSTNQIGDEQWRDMEQKGAVFLPAAGGRLGTGPYGRDGNYWSASVVTTNTDYVWHVGFNSAYFDPGTNQKRCYGFSVRLVLYVK